MRSSDDPSSVLGQSPELQPSGEVPRELRPTGVRWHILGLLAIIAGLTYLDRLNLSIVGKQIQDEFAFSNETMGFVLSAFVLGYALFQVPGGWLGDRYGPRGVLTAAIVFWSLFTAATGLAPRLPLANWFSLAWSFAVVRFLVGVGEATAFPNSNRIVAFWMGAGGRGLGNSLFLFGIGAGGALTPLFISRIMAHWGWRMSFYICALVGSLVALTWHLYATNRPEEHPRVNAGELALIHATPTTDAGHSPAPTASGERTPWAKMFSSVSVWGLILSYSCIAYAAYIFYTWFFIYLLKVRGLTVTQGSFWGATPFLGIALLVPVGGWFSDRVVARLGKRRGRQCAVWVGAACSAGLMWAGGHAENNTLAILLLAGAAGFNLFATVTWWAVCNDLTRSFSGSLSGLMNMFGNLGGWLSPIVTGYIATRLGWTQALGFGALVTLTAGVLWLLVNATQNLEEPCGIYGQRRQTTDTKPRID
jgi:ACS family glucarate transporter-like MFS transporter